MVFENKNALVAIIGSVLFHVMVLVLFLFVKVKWQYNVLDFTEIAFVSGEQSVSRTPAAQKVLPPPATGKEPSDVVKLPLRNMLEQEPPQIKVADEEKKLTSEEKLTLPKAEELFDRERTDKALLTELTAQDKQIAMPGKGLSLDDKLLPSSSPANISETGRETPYEIEGQVAKRIVTHKVIPEYPKDLHQQAVVKIAFTVLPNGQIGEMIPLIKADAQLEKITLDALRQWRFNPLPSYEPQRVERGVITFRYLLK